ncbi:bacteriocin fulvocin C-related protein [Streptomyces sp. D2-8]|nr:bacteriocin fulvocin C-related protein [Streptomyces sp. D2-8]
MPWTPSGLARGQVAVTPRPPRPAPRGRLGAAHRLPLQGRLGPSPSAPAFARGGDEAAAQEFVRAHAGRLPTRYDEVAALPLAHRRAVHSALPPAKRSALRVEHIDRWRSAHPDLTPAQARAVASDVSTFEFERGRRGTDEILRVDAAAEAAFEPAAANALLATLGPAEAAALPDCECNTYSDKCWGSSCIWVENPCVRSDSGCGTRRAAVPDDGGPRASRYLCLIRRNVTEFAGKVYVNFPATPRKVDVTGVTGVSVSVFTASASAASVVTRALEATLAPPRSTAVRASAAWALTTLTIRSPVFASLVTTWRNGSAGLSSVKLPHSLPSRSRVTWRPRTLMSMS